MRLVTTLWTLETCGEAADRLCDCLRDTCDSVLLVNALLQCNSCNSCQTLGICYPDANRLCCLCTYVASNGVFSDICVCVRRCKHVS